MVEKCDDCKMLLRYKIEGDRDNYTNYICPNCGKRYYIEGNLSGDIDTCENE